MDQSTVAKMLLKQFFQLSKNTFAVLPVPCGQLLIKLCLAFIFKNLFIYIIREQNLKNKNRGAN